MKIIPLGVGGGFTKKGYHTNFFICIGKYNLLVDAGTTLRDSLKDAKVNLDKISHIFITHFHHDHVGGLSELLIKAFWNFKNGKHSPHRPVLIMRRCQEEIIGNLLAPSLNNEGLTWKDFCIPHVIDGNIYENDFFKLKVLPTDNLHCQGMQSCGIKLSEVGTEKEVIISGDIKKLQESNLVEEITSSTKAIFQDVSFTNNSVHSSITEVLKYYPSTVYPLIYGVHFEDFYYGSKGTNSIKWAEERAPIYI